LGDCSGLLVVDDTAPSSLTLAEEGILPPPNGGL